jgi:hypothetical protein
MSRLAHRFRQVVDDDPGVMTQLPAPAALRIMQEAAKYLAHETANALGAGLARFLLTEVEEFRQIGLDLGDVRHQNDIEQEVSRWAHTLADERFALLEKIAAAMAKAKRVKLPPKLNAVPSAGSSR